MKNNIKLYGAMLISISGSILGTTQFEFKLGEIVNNTDQQLILKVNDGNKLNQRIAPGATFKRSIGISFKGNPDNANAEINRDIIEIWTPTRKLFGLAAERTKNGELVKTQVQLIKFAEGRQDVAASWQTKLLKPANDIYTAKLDLIEEGGEIKPAHQELMVKLLNNK